MALKRPYITEKFTAYRGDTLITTLSLVIQPIDDYTKRDTIGKVKVKIRDGNITAYKSPSGYFVFVDLDNGIYSVTIESDLYFPEEITVDTSDLDLSNPLIEIVLKPLHFYPFPANATLVRGLVRELITKENPVENAEIKVASKDIETRTDENGEFVLYFKDADMEEVSIEIKKHLDIKKLDMSIIDRETISMGIITFP